MLGHSPCSTQARREDQQHTRFSTSAQQYIEQPNLLGPDTRGGRPLTPTLFFFPLLTLTQRQTLHQVPVQAAKAWPRNCCKNTQLTMCISQGSFPNTSVNRCSSSQAMQASGVPSQPCAYCCAAATPAPVAAAACNAQSDGYCEIKETSVRHDSSPPATHRSQLHSTEPFPSLTTVLYT